MYMLLSIDWLFILHCILCFSAFLLQFSRSPGMKRAHRQSKVFKSSEGHTKQQNAEVALWSWKESAGIRRPGPDGNSMYCLLLRKAEGKRTPVCMLGEQSWCQGQDQTPRSKPSVMYEQLTNEQNVVRMTAYTVCCGRAALSQLSSVSVLWRCTELDRTSGWVLFRCVGDGVGGWIQHWVNRRYGLVTEVLHYLFRHLR